MAVTQRRTLIQSILSLPTVLLNKDTFSDGKYGVGPGEENDDEPSSSFRTCSLCHWNPSQDKDNLPSSRFPEDPSLLTEAVRRMIGFDSYSVFFCDFCCGELQNLLSLKAEMDRLEDRLFEMIKGVHNLLTQETSVLSMEEGEEDSASMEEVVEGEEVQEEEDPSSGQWITVEKVYSLAVADDLEESTDSMDHVISPALDDDPIDCSSPKFEEATLPNDDHDVAVHDEETRPLEPVDSLEEYSLTSVPSSKMGTRGLKRARKDPHFVHRRYPCHLCPLRFGSKNGIERHLITHLPLSQRPDTVPCPHCPHVSRDKFNLMAHLKTHLPPEEMPYGCNTCEKKFTSKHGFEQHLKTLGHICKSKSFSKKPQDDDRTLL